MGLTEQEAQTLARAVRFIARYGAYLQELEDAGHHRRLQLLADPYSVTRDQRQQELNSMEHSKARVRELIQEGRLAQVFFIRKLLIGRIVDKHGAPDNITVKIILYLGHPEVKTAD